MKNPDQKTMEIETIEIHKQEAVVVVNGASFSLARELTEALSRVGLEKAIEVIGFSGPQSTQKAEEEYQKGGLDPSLIILGLFFHYGGIKGGIEFAEKIRKQEELKDIPIIFFSNFAHLSLFPVESKSSDYFEIKNYLDKTGFPAVDKNIDPETGEIRGEGEAIDSLAKLVLEKLGL